MNLITRELESVQRLWFSDASVAQNEPGNCFGSSRGCRDDFKTELEHLGSHHRERRTNKRSTTRNGAWVQCGAREESISEPDCSQLKTSCEHHLVVNSDHDFGRTATDITDKHRAIMDPDCTQHTEVNESCLFDTRHHFDVNSSFFTNPLDELRTIFGLTYGTRRNGTKFGIV